MSNKDQRLGEVRGYWLSQRPNSRQWCRTWFDVKSRQTRRSSLGTDDLEEAKLRLAGWVMLSGTMTSERPDAVPLQTCLIRYYQHPGRHLPSAEQTRHALTKWSEFFAETLVSELVPERQRAFVDWLRAKDLSDGCIRRILGVGQAALNMAHRDREIATVPAISLALAPDSGPRERLLTIEESAALFQAVTVPHQAMYLLLAFGTAARPAAILELTTFQVDCDARLIKLNPPGRKQNKKRRPTLPICDTLLPYLRGLPPGPVVDYQGRAIASFKTHLTDPPCARRAPSARTAQTSRESIAVASAGRPPGRRSRAQGHEQRPSSR
jgi:integrase